MTYIYLGTSIVMVCAQAAFFQMLLHKASLVNKMLNPVSSGMVTLA